MQALTWLHLSDIRFGSKEKSSNPDTREQLLQYLNRCFQDEPELLPEFIFYTGGIANKVSGSKSLSRKYEQATQFFKQLLEICSLPKERLFVVPGRLDVGDQYSEFISETLPHQFAANQKDCDAYVVKVAGISVGICGLNANRDFGFNFFAETGPDLELQLEHAYAKLRNTSLRLALMHEPVRYLSELKRVLITHRLSRDFHFFLHGSSHVAWVEPGALTTIAAGGEYMIDGDEFGINLVRLDPATGKGQVHLHRYDKQGWMICPVPNHAPKGIWEFQLPRALQKAGPDRNADLLDKSIAIQSLELKDIRGFTDLKLELSTPSGNDGQWIVFLGQNGVGKTTLLRSLALALRNLDDRPIWPDAFSGWSRTIDRNGTLARHAFIKTVLADGSVHQTNITSNGSTKFSQTPEQNQPGQCLLFAYGCRRGSTTGGPKREYSFDKEGGPEIATLFEEFAGMVHAETWLKDLSSKPALLRAVLDAIKTFLDVDAVELRDNNLLITEHDKPPLALKQLSDGYLTSAGWFIDLLARWIDYAERQGKIIEPGFMQQMRGLVLIDEIDMHLHPRWQIEIIRRTRTLMPQMSFIVTTHNPLTLVGAKAEEIWMLENDGGNIVATRGVEAPMLLTGGQIYTRYFGIRDIYPDGLGSDMQRYNFLSRYALRNDAEDNELQELHQRLAQAGILPEWPIVAREGATAKSVKPSPKPRRRVEVKK